jgi:triphosphatase
MARPFADVKSIFAAQPASARRGSNPPMKSRITRAIPKSAPPKAVKAKTHPLAAWSKAVPIAIKVDATVDDIIATVVTACRDHWQKNLAAAIDGRQPEALHQVRVALRRTRSALSAFKKFIPVPQRSALNAEAKWLLSQLGGARDLDVFVQELSAPVNTHISDNADLAQLMRIARTAQLTEHDNAAKALKSPRAKRLAARMEAWVSGRGWRVGETLKNAKAAPGTAFARKFLNRKLRNMRAEYNAVETLSVGDRHALRIAIKKVRYAIEFMQAVLPAKKVQRVNGILKDLQDNLGHLNDIAVAERTVNALVNQAGTGLARRQIAAAGTTIGAWHKKAATAAEPETAKLWRKLKKAPTF